MIRESVAYKIAVALYKFLKEGRIYELVSKLFYFSRYSIVFEFVRKEAKKKYISTSFFLMAAKNLYGFCITKSFNILQKFRRFWTNSFLVKLLKSQIILFKKRPIFIFIFYIFAFYVGFFIGEVIKNRISLAKVLILFILIFLNFLSFQENISKYTKNSFILRFFHEIFS
ncbi:hypothetical protein [Caldicellulosiruptor naganoensis]|uniref:Uncharacterized protein n=1 Tax=Caldicellulosiruptor naganoensis TaxID=29324 RepID=A0ABY7BIC5_9FIRM|nr:hypothetical protein [Caldicellulosiruptor naganoensis]WAM32354.1 hypothetical protein OTJ99_000890 [Caldicellulosiruptor naganoensis]